MSQSLSPKLPKGIEVFERGWLSANNIFIWGDGNTSLVDTGYVSQDKLTLSLVQHALQKHQLPTLTKIVNTHLHSDHCGGNQLLHKTFNCPISIPIAESAAVKHWNENLLSFKATGQDCPAFKYEHLLEPGQTIRLGSYDWDILAAPGHAPHAIMLYQASNRLLISADALWEEGFGVVFPELTGESGFEEVAQTIDLIETLDVDLVIPGHGKPFNDVKKAIDTARSRLDYLSTNISRNARHAAKVLLKFKLLEWQTKDIHLVNTWMLETPLFTAIAKQLDMTLDELITWLPPALCEAGGARIDQAQLINID
jgi:glyoxylase-like metal-dependent hydrolase (beta-lactamase superfamily II)